MVQGGLPVGSSVVLQGPPGQEKLRFALTFLAEGLKAGGSGLVVSSSQSPDAVVAELRDLGVNLDPVIKENRLRVVDWYSWSEETVHDIEERGIVLRSSIDLTNLGVALSRAIAGLGGHGERRAVIELLSPATHSYDVTQVYAFAQSAKRKFDRHQFTSLVLLEKEMHSGPQLTTLHQPFDGVIEIERIRSGDRIVRKIGVLHLKDTAPDPTFRVLEISEAGMQVAQDAAKRDVSVPAARGSVLESQDERAHRLRLIMQIASERLKLNPGDADALFAMAAAQATLDDAEGAVQTLDHLAALDSAYPGLWVLKTKLHAKLGQTDLARQSRVRAQQSEPEAAKAIDAMVPCPMCEAPVAIDATTCANCGVKFAPTRSLEDELDDLGHAAIQEMVEQELGAEPKPAPEAGEDLAKVGPPPPAKRRPKPAAKPSKRGLTNGLVLERGVGRRTGATNGLKGRTNGLRGRTNGLTNGLGRTNGLTNGIGRTNGLTNGLGRTNGLANRLGRTNGLTNGLGRTNGITNGLGRTNGITNGLGRTNGLTNGLGGIRTTGFRSGGTRGRMQHAGWKLYLIPLVAVGLLLVPLFFVPEYSGPAYPIRIDGDFADWPSTSLVRESPSSQLSPNIDIVGIGIAENLEFLALYVEVEGTILQGGGSPPGTMDAIRFFADVDNSTASGYRVDGLGADRMLEITGHAGVVNRAVLYEFDANRASNDWGGWTKPAPAGAAGSGSRVEAQVDFQQLAASNRPVSVSVRTQSWNGETDRADIPLSPKVGTLALVQESQSPSMIAGPSVPLLRITATAYRQTVSLGSLRLEIIGAAAPSAASTLELMDATGNPLDQVVPVSRDVLFQFPTRQVAVGTTTTFYVTGDFTGGNGETFGLRIPTREAVGIINGVASVRLIPSPRLVAYVGASPAGPQVDGGFGEWTTPSSDATGESSLRGNANIDLQGYGTLASGPATYVYANVTGRMFEGTAMPVAPFPVPPPGTTPASDVDRDSVPDVDDLLPYDFNNDGVTDAQTGGDYDGDGLTDYGFLGGMDMWLNTTIPGSFPAPYAGRNVTVYIGPTSRPVVTGDDALRVFLDIDNRSSSGYAIGGIGADRLVEIRGKDGVATQSALLSFAGSFPGDWVWNPMSPVTVALGYGEIELSVPVNASMVLFEIGDFFGGVDSTASLAVGAPPLSPMRGSLFSAAANSFTVSPPTEPLAVPWQQAGPGVTATTPIDGGSNAVSTLYNHQRKVVRAGDVTGDTACDATNSDGCWYAVFYDQLSEITSTTAPSTETVTTGSKVSGTFPTDASSEDGTFIQYREGGADGDHYPGTETISTGTGCGGIFPGDLSSSNNVYRCLREGQVGTQTIAFDAASNGTTPGATSFSWSHGTSGTDRLLVVGVSLRQAGATMVSSITYDGTALTLIRADTNGGNVRTELWYLIAPATGTMTIQVTLSASERAVGGAVTFTGAHQSAPIGNHGGATGASTTPAVTITSAAGEIVMDTVGVAQEAASPCTPGSGQTERWDAFGGTGANAAVGCGSTEPGAASVVMDWTLSANRNWAISGVSLKPAPNYQLSTRHDWSGIPTDGSSYDVCVETHITSAAGESMLLQVLTPPSTWNTRITVTKAADDNADQCYTLTSAEFNSGAPSIRWIGGTESGDSTQSDINVDNERVIRRLANKDLLVRYDWTGVPAGNSYTLKVKGYRQDENVNVQVLTPPSTWDTRITITATTNTLYTYTLTTSEYNSGAPSIRFIDASGADAVRSDVWIDLAVVTTTSLWDRTILMRSSDTSGSTWGSQIILASGRSADSPLLYSYDSSEPSIAIDSGGFLHMVWVSASATGNQDTFDRVRYARTTVAYPTQSELTSAANWESITVVDDTAPGFMPTISTDTSNAPHVAWSSSKTSGTVYYKNKSPGTIAFGATSNATGSGVSSLTWSHTTSGAERLLVVGVSFRQAGTTTVSSITYAGTSLTFIRADTNAGAIRTELWYLTAPATGANNVVATLSAAENIVGGAVSFTGAHQSAPIGNHGGATGASTTPSVTISSAAGEIVTDTVGAHGATASPCTPGSGQTERWDAQGGTGGPAAVGCGSTEPGAASVAMDWTLSASRPWAISAVGLKPALAWKATVSWGTTYTGVSVDVSPQNNYVSLARYYEAATNEIQYTVCKTLSSNACDAAAEFTKFDGTAGVDTVASAVESASYPSLATTFEANGDLWVAYAKDVDGTTRAIYARFLDYPSAGWAATETVDSLSGTTFTKPSIGVDKDNNLHALYVATSGPQVYYNKRTGGSWGSREAVGTSSDNPTLVVRAPNDATYGTSTAGLYWKTSTSETYFFIPEFEFIVAPILGVLFLGVLRRRVARRKGEEGLATSAPDQGHP